MKAFDWLRQFNAMTFSDETRDKEMLRFIKMIRNNAFEEAAIKCENTPRVNKANLIRDLKEYD